jgi:DNA-binding transcriptional LysR family regulator
LEIQQLRHLISAVNHGNLLRAADECNISQSGLSRSIRSLEERLSVQLLMRKSKGVEPTVYGKSVVRWAHLILSDVNRSLEELKALQSADIGTVSFGVTQNFGYYLVPDLLVRLNETHPGIQFNVSTGGFLDLMEELQQGHIEFAFGLLGPINQTEAIKVEPIRDHHSRVVARSGHPLTQLGREISPEELANAHWATLSGRGFQSIFAEYFSSKGLKAPVQVVRTDSISLIRRLVAKSDMLAVLPPDVVLDNVEAGAFAILDCEAPAEHTEVGFLFRPSSLMTPQMQLAVDAIRRYFTVP